jgi:hypothetical protein
MASGRKRKDFGLRLEQFLNRGSKVFRKQLLAYGRNTKKKYGLGLEEYVKLLDLQNGKCGICGLNKPYNLHVDHNHQTGRVRGLLCFHCNAALGHFRDNKELLKKASTYIEKTEGL